MAVELATAYISLVPSTRGIKGQIEREISGPLAAAGTTGGQGFAANLLTNTTDGLRRFGDRIVDTATTAAKIGATTVAAIIGASLWGGLGRTLDTEDARKLFGQLGLSVRGTDRLMDDLNETFLTGPFAYPDVYDISSQLFASGVGLENLVGVTEAVGNMAAFAQEDLSRVGEVTSVIGANGRVMASELNRLGQMGIPIRQILAEALDISGEELSAMVADGQLTSDMFFDLIGEASQFEGAMESFGDTTRGAWSIMKAGIAGVGEALLSPWFGEGGDMASFLQRINDVIFDKVQPAVAAFGESLRERLIPAFERVAGFVTGTLIPAISSAVEWFGENRDAIVRVAKAVGPAVAIVGGLATSIALVSRALALSPVGIVLAIASGLVYAWQNSEKFRAVVTTAFEAVRAVIDPVVDAVSRLVDRFRGGDGLAGAGERVAGFVDRIVGAFREGGAIFDWFAGLWESIGPRFESIGEAFGQIGRAIQPVVQWIGERLPGAFQTLWSIASPILGFIVHLIADTLRLAIDGVVQVFEGAVNIIAGVLEVFAGLFTGDWSRLWEGVKQIGVGIWDAIVGLVKVWLAVSVFKVIGGAFRAIGRLFTRSWQSIRSTFANAGQNIVATVRGWVETVYLRFLYLRDSAVRIITNAWETIRTIFSGGTAFVRQVVRTAFNNARTAVTQAMARIRTSVREGVQRVVQFFRDLPRRILEALGNIGSRLREAGAGMMSDLASGITGRVGDVTGAVGGALSSVRNLLPSSPAKEGPFSGRGWTRYSGRSMMEDLARGIMDRGDLPADQVAQVASRTQAALAPGLAASRRSRAQTAQVATPPASGRAGMRDLVVQGRPDPVALFRARNLIQSELGALA